jgi:hypothetical protein
MHFDMKTYTSFCAPLWLDGDLQDTSVTVVTLVKFWHKCLSCYAVDMFRSLFYNGSRVRTSFTVAK